MTSDLPLAVRFSDWVIPHILSSGCFRPSCKILSYHVDPERKGEDQFSSEIQFYELDVQVRDVLKSVNVMVKFQPESEVREVFSAKDQFENELLAYSEIFPLLERDGIIQELFPHFYYGLADRNMNDDRDFIVVEDLSVKGYTLSKEKVFLDYDHCVLALKGIGKFHALSYLAKKTRKAEFMSLISRINKKWSKNSLEHTKYILLFCGQRGVLPLMNERQNVKLLTEFLKNYDDVANFYSSLVDPVEPEAVFCHGDFCRNNMLFAYNDDGKPVSVKFFDLQSPCYSSPVIDLSFFLLMNTSNETREKYWDEFLNVYMESVKSVAPEIEIPKLDFQRFGVYGYIHCSYYLPIMMSNSASSEIRNDLFKLSPYEMGLTESRRGGKKETDALVNIIRFLLSRKCIQERYF